MDNPHPLQEQLEESHRRITKGAKGGFLSPELLEDTWNGVMLSHRCYMDTHRDHYKHVFFNMCDVLNILIDELVKHSPISDVEKYNKLRLKIENLKQSLD